MPTIAVVDGVKIQVYWDDHPPAHFHIEYSDYRAQVAIDSLQVIHGYIPNAQFRKVIAWATPRKSKLLDAWIKCQNDLHPGKIV